MESFLKSDGDKIDILFSCNGDMALGAIQAIEAAGLKPGEDIVIVSIDAAKGEFNAMIEGKMNCAVEHTPNFGETLMETAKKIVAGEEAVSYTHLDVYKRQSWTGFPHPSRLRWKQRPPCGRWG